MASPPDTAVSNGFGAVARVLVIEDEPGIVDFLHRGLSAAGFAVQSAQDGIAGERQALEGGVDIVILDLMLPGRGGFAVLSTLRDVKPELPVIVLTARGEVEDRVAGLDGGAVDYLVKPFAMSELTARLRAHLRVSARPVDVQLRAGDIEVDLLSRRVTRAGREIPLSTTEFELLVHLLRHRGQVCTRRQILGSVWGYEHEPSTNVVDVYIGYLRRKLGRGPDDDPIVTVRSVGYRLRDGS